MKKNYYLLILVMLLSVAAKAQTDWITVKLDEKISVKFPSEPEKKIANGTVSYVVKAKDSVKYGAVIIDFKVTSNLDSANLAPVKDSQEFANQLRLGMVSQKKEYTFGDIIIGKWQTFTAYSMSGTKDADKSKLSVKMVIIGSKIYSLTCSVPENLDAKNSEVFLDSVVLLKP